MCCQLDLLNQASVKPKLPKLFSWCPDLNSNDSSELSIDRQGRTFCAGGAHYCVHIHDGTYVVPEFRARPHIASSIDAKRILLKGKRVDTVKEIVAFSNDTCTDFFKVTQASIQDALKWIEKCIELSEKFDSGSDTSATAAALRDLLCNQLERPAVYRPARDDVLDAFEAFELVHKGLEAPLTANTSSRSYRVGKILQFATFRSTFFNTAPVGSAWVPTI